ncbi:hypothetical protein [Sedimentitalea sp.]|uniref:hypothetical protein n=1 Tax=Sedimentitalea sp. TaxID=2048915 RepID=UPI003299879D
MFRLIQPLLERTGWLSTGQFLVLITCFLPVWSAAEIVIEPPAPPQSGLIWNRTGLPAVFPLQVKTPAGQDYFLTLIDAGTSVEALAAYIHGGSFFKVLVPPGTYILQFSFGDVWQGEERLFGSGVETGSFELQPPLTFYLRGGGTKAGHLVELNRILDDLLVTADVKAQSICQTRIFETSPPFKARYPHASRTQDGMGTLSKKSSLLEKGSPNLDLHSRRKHKHPNLPYFRFEVRSRYCD